VKVFSVKGSCLDSKIKNKEKPPTYILQQARHLGSQRHNKTNPVSFRSFYYLRKIIRAEVGILIRCFLNKRSDLMADVKLTQFARAAG